MCNTPVTYMTPVDVKVSAGGNVTSPEQLQDANIVIGVGLARGFKSRDIKIALTTGLIESKLFNLAYGDKDSKGIFQQRPSAGVWGTSDQIMDPVHATNKFYDALASIRNRDSMPEARVAYEVQRPADEASYTASYSFWEADALKLLAAAPDAAKINLTSSTVVLPQAGCGVYGASDPASAVVQAALSQQNQPYMFGAKSNPLSPDGGAGFTSWAWAKAGVKLATDVAKQYSLGTVIDGASASVGDVNKRIQSLKPGDLLFWKTGDAGQPRLSHVALYVGSGNIIDSSLPGETISVKPIPWGGVGRTYAGATRPPIPNNASGTKDGWAWPLKSITVTSPFGQRFHPTQRVWMLHDGVDFVAPLGTPIFAAHDGTIVAPFGTGFGNQIILDHGGGILTGYAHMDRFAPGMTVGSAIKVGQLIGYSGSTGWSTAAHLHFRVLVNRVPVDPIPFMRTHGLVP